MTRIWLVRLAPCYFSSLLLLGKSSTPRHEKSIAIPSIDNVTKSVAASLFAHSVPSTTLRLLLGQHLTKLLNGLDKHLELLRVGFDLRTTSRIGGETSQMIRRRSSACGMAVSSTGRLERK